MTIKEEDEDQLPTPKVAKEIAPDELGPIEKNNEKF